MSVQDIADIALETPRAPGGPNSRTRGRKKTAHSHAGEACKNCGAQLLGAHCHVCGQPAHVHRSLLHAVEEFLHGLLHLDERTWRTLPKLFFRPGTLTREYIDGRRADHVPPMALFLLVVFALFVAFSFGAGEGFVQDNRAAVRLTEADIVEQRQQVAGAEAELARAQAELAAASGPNAPPGAQAAAQGVLSGVEATVKARAARLAEMEADLKAQAADPDKAITTAAPPRSIAEELQAATERGDITINTGSEKMNEEIRHKLSNPELFFYKLQNNAYKYAFLFVPLTLLFLWLLFVGKRNLTLYDHVIFSLYSLSFVGLAFLVLMIAGAINAGARDAMGEVVVFAIPLHLYFQLKGAYRLGWFSALWRLLVLLVFLSVVVGLFVAAIVALGAMG